MADFKSTIMFNVLAYKAPAMVMSEDFAFTGFGAPTNTNNSLDIHIISDFIGVNYSAFNTQKSTVPWANWCSLTHTESYQR